MKFTLKWLKEHLETDASLDALAERLTMLGLEVEEISDAAADPERLPNGQSGKSRTTSRCGQSACLYR